jgi:2-succinyl-6-hydroxy-2,4-cyclohexadiene-1-carboxylate synthase
MKKPADITLWCLHGAFGAATDWQSFAHAMAQRGMQVRMVDLWRFLDCCPRSLTATAQAINDEASTNPKTNILVGYSMGGRIALHSLLADNHPWTAAIIVSAHPGLADPAEKSARLQHDTTWSVRCLHDPWESLIEKWNSQDILQSPPDDPRPTPLQRPALSMRRKEIARSFIDWSLGAQENLWPRLAAITAPVLWISGDHDPKFTDIAHRASHFLPNATQKTIAHSGHRVPWDQPTALTNEVASWILSVTK